MHTRTPSPTHGPAEDRLVVAPYATATPGDARHRNPARREVVNGVRASGTPGADWRLMPHELPPWPLGEQPRRCWMAAGGCAAIGQDRRILLRRAAHRPAAPTARLDRRRV